VALAGAAVAERDNVLPAQNVLAARQLQDQHFVEGRDRSKIEAIEPLYGREARGANAPFHHAALALDQLELAKPEQIAHMIDTAARAFLGNFPVFGEKGGQFELLQMVLEKQLRFVRGLRHAAARSSSAA
jgi:hypothetical protein